MKDINTQLRNIINERGIKLTKVSMATGIKYQRLNRIFNQHTPMLATEFISLCAFLVVDPNSFKETA